MRIYFENYNYPNDQIEPYLDKGILYPEENGTKLRTDRIGYIFVSKEKYSGPVFILPKSFLININGKDTVLGLRDVFPDDVIDTDDESNPLELAGKGSFLPELALWLYRALNRFRNEHEGTPISQKAELDSQLPEDCARDKDFLSTVLDLIDFLKDHRNLFTQISIINHSGRDKIDWPRTVTGDPFFKDGEAWYFDPAIKEKTINIDDTLIVLYYSVLQYLRDKYRFPINLGEVPYTLLPPKDIQGLIDTGIGSKRMQSIRHKYYRDDLKHLWSLLDSFFSHNRVDDTKPKLSEHLLVRKFQIIFEEMVDKLISDTNGVEELKNQADGKLIDHIFRSPSLIGTLSDIYYIGDSKYYADKNRPEGTALYKQFTYAKNTIQYYIDKYHFTKQHFPGTKKKKGDLRYRDTLTEGYNITPNFFIRSRVTDKDREYDLPSLAMTIWNEDKGQKFPKPNKHFEDRLFDRDTLILREFSINLLFVIAAYAGYEDSYWFTDLHRTIRNSFIDSIDEEYDFYKITPQNETTLGFDRIYTHLLNGKSYTIHETDEYLIVAFEKSEQGRADKRAFDKEKLRSMDTGQEIKYDIVKTSLRELNTE